MSGERFSERPFREPPQRHATGEMYGPRHAYVRRSFKGDPKRWACWRYHEDGSFAPVIFHWLKRSAEKLAREWTSTFDPSQPPAFTEGI